MGLLDLPPAGKRLESTGGNGIRNDEARSLLLVGPIPEGLLIQVFDNGDGSSGCADDFTFILIKQRNTRKCALIHLSLLGYLRNTTV